MEQVICINGDIPNDPLGWEGDPVVKGQIYTIRGVYDYLDGSLGYFLEEVSVGGFLNGDYEEYTYDSRRFAPIKDDAIEIFRAIDRKIFKRKKQDA